MNQSNVRRAPAKTKQIASRKKRSRRKEPVGEGNIARWNGSILYRNPGRVSTGIVANLVVLIVFGLIVLFSASYATGFYEFRDSYHFIRPQIIVAVIGGLAMWMVSRVDYHWLAQWTWICYAAAIMLLIFVLFMKPQQGCRRWIPVPVFGTIQPSEIAKFAMILVLAFWFDRYRERIEKFSWGVVAPMIFLGPVLALLFLEPHHSAMILMICITGVMMMCGGCRLKPLILGGGGACALIGLLIALRPGYVQVRFQSWFEPFSDMQNTTMQTGQSLYTIGSGGLFGVGIGNSVQKHSWLPEAPNDFIFSILCEELGFVGAVICIGLFAMLVTQGILIAMRAPDRFGFLLALGVTAQIAFQFFFNVAVVTNLAPNTGISLPFFSHGGTSMLMLMGEMGVVLSVSRAANKKESKQAELEQKKKEEKQERENLQQQPDLYY